MNKCGPKKLDASIIQKIRSLYKSNGMTQKSLAEQFQLSQSTISKIINHDIHKNTPEISIGGSADVKLKVVFKYGN